jgi:hypothetical protein
MTPSGIEPATFRFVAQYLNHCVTAAPHIIYLYKRKLVICTISELLTESQRTSVSCASSHIVSPNNVCVVGPLNYLSFIVFIFAIYLSVSLGRPIALHRCGHERSFYCDIAEHPFAPRFFYVLDAVFDVMVYYDLYSPFQ